MILIADSGSTKTSWVVAGNGQKNLEFQSQGFNPYTQTKEFISQTFKTEVFPKIEKFDIRSLYFYGAGCSTAENKKLVHDCFQEFLKDTKIEVEHDLLSAARALWFDKEGIVAILGTGSNSCVYDGQRIIKAIPSLGYILGDEGSGCYMGKMLVRDFLYGKMPRAIHEKFHVKYRMGGTAILDHIYKKDNPNRWMASLALFVSENIGEDYCQNLVLNSMHDFFEAHLSQYRKWQDMPLGVNGSIGFFFREYLETVSKSYNFHLEKAIKSPIDELVRYHLTKESPT